MAPSYFSHFKKLCTNLFSTVKTSKPLNTIINQKEKQPLIKSIQKATLGSSLSSTFSSKKICFNVTNNNHSRIPLKCTIYTQSSLLPQKNSITFQLLKLTPNTFLKNIQLLTIPKAQFSTSKDLRGPMAGSRGVTPLVDDCPQISNPEKIKRHDCPLRLAPCLKYVKPPGALNISPSKDCGRICMPCCPKARFPPLCSYPIKKKECIICPNPRPAFSECPKHICMYRDICDCCDIRPPPCYLLPDVQNEC